MNLYAIEIDYPQSSILVGWNRTKKGSVKLLYRLKKDPCYASDVVVWTLKQRKVRLMEWIYGRPDQ